MASESGATKPAIGRILLRSVRSDHLQQLYSAKLDGALYPNYSLHPCDDPTGIEPSSDGGAGPSQCC